MELDPRQEGSVSKWNEGNLKSIRLHECQELINISKINPLKSLPEHEWNYERWFNAINTLYGEGQSKYSTEEIIEIEKIKDLILYFINEQPPIDYLNHVEKGKMIKKVTISKDRWQRLRKLIELYEKKVKYFNDIHGLSTQNYDYEFEGL